MMLRGAAQDQRVRVDGSGSAYHIVDKGGGVAPGGLIEDLVTSLPGPSQRWSAYRRYIRFSRFGAASRPRRKYRWRQSETVFTALQRSALVERESFDCSLPVLNLCTICMPSILTEAICLVAPLVNVLHMR